MDNDSSGVLSLLQLSNRQVWVQAIGRALYQSGYGLIQFYIPLIFVNQVGLSATTVGLGVGSGSLAGVLGHLLGGYLADSPTWGRKRTLLLSATLAILATLVLALTQTLPMLIFGNLLLGLGAGCYWTAADASVMDVTGAAQRHQAFAVLSLADSLGSGIGVLGGGFVLTLVKHPQTLFLAVTGLFLIFLVVFQFAITEIPQHQSLHSSPLQGFAMAIKDRALQLFILGNVLFTTYIALISSTLPLYLTNVVSVGATAVSASAPGAESSVVSVATLYTWFYIGLGAIVQIPIAQVLGSIPRVRVLMLSMLLWGGGFLLVWVTGVVTSVQLLWAIAALCVLAIATSIYKPFAPTIVAELAPASLRGVYIAISYQCWSIGYFIGPILGGWEIDQPRSIAHGLWLAGFISTISGLVVLGFLSQTRRFDAATAIRDGSSV